VPEITGAVHHVNFSVSDLEASARWYQELFQLTELARLEHPDGEWSKIVMRHPSGLIVGLTHHRRNDGAPFEEWRCGADHVAFEVGTHAALEAWPARLAELGIPHSPIKTTPLGELITIRDPDNVQLELYASGAR